MVFPATPVPVKVELDLVGDWSSPTDITTYVYGRDPLSITRGKTAEGATVDPSTLGLTLDNRDGRFSPRNPLGAYYGLLGRNTPIRVSVLAGSVRGSGTAYGSGTWSTPDSVANSITGDIDIRADFRPEGWRFNTSGTARLLVYKDIGGTNRSWQFSLQNSGLLTLFWWPTGTGSVLRADSTIPLPFPVTGRKAVRVTLDVNNGASGWTATFYYSDTISGTWVQLGDAVTTAGTTSLFNSTASVRVDCSLATDFYAAQVRNGIGGTVVLNPDFTAQAEGTTSFADSASATWTGSSASVTARRWRFHGEVSAWPQAWDSTGSDVYVQVTAAGVLRRLGQGATELESSLRRGVLGVASSVVGYWPAEDEADSEQLAAAIGDTPIFLGAANSSLSSYTGFDASKALPTVDGHSWTGVIPSYGATGEVQARVLMAVPSGGATNGAIPLRVKTSGTASTWQLVYSTGGSLTLKAYDAEEVNILDSGAILFAVNGKNLLISIELTQNGSNIDWRTAVLEQGGTAGSYTSGTLNSRTVGRAIRVVTNPLGLLTDTAMGHIHVQSEVTSLFELQDQLNAFVGEFAGIRLLRLAGEEGLTASVIGYPDDTSAMGPQLPATLLDLLKECADADQGLLYESRNATALVLRTRVGTHNQDAAVTLAYDSQHLSALDPVDDDQSVRNDVTVSRPSASSFRATLDTGALSTADPPAGIGRYTDSLTANVETDGQLADLAGWRLHLGTVDETRYPAVGVALERAPFVASASLRSGVLDADVGDAATITGLPAWLPPGDADQLVRGYTEDVSNFAHGVTYVGEPGSPWQVGIYDDAEAVFDSDGSETSVLANSTTTSLTVNTSTGPVWSHSGGDFDILVGGERMTVTAVSGSTAIQTFTVTRSVNGVVKSQLVGTTVELAVPTIYAI